MHCILHKQKKKKGDVEMKYLSKVLAAVAVLATGAASMGCLWYVFDEPKAPKSMCD